jgi:hypothetical protein
LWFIFNDRNCLKEENKEIFELNWMKEDWKSGLLCVVGIVGKCNLV